MPPNPTSLAALEDIPNQFQRTLQGEQFLPLDQKPDDEEEGRVLVFATRRNVEMLCKSPVWFVDKTFKESPTLFTQLFTVIGLRKRNHLQGKDTPLPYVYALLEGKHQDE